MNNFWHSWRVFHIKWFAWQKGIQLTDWYFTRGHTWRNYAGFGSKRWWWSYPRLYRTTRYSFFFICTVIWFDSSKTSALSWRYIRAKYAHALQTHTAVSFCGSFCKMASFKTTLSNYCFILSFMLFHYLLNGFLCGQKLCKVIHIIADLAWMGQQQNVDNIKSAQ